MATRAQATQAEAHTCKQRVDLGGRGQRDVAEAVVERRLLRRGWWRDRSGLEPPYLRLLVEVDVRLRAVVELLVLLRPAARRLALGPSLAIEAHLPNARVRG